MDLLTSLGITPDGIVGHSAGELACAYADGCFTAEQTVLAAYWRGRSILESKLQRGAMAAVGKDITLIYIQLIPMTKILRLLTSSDKKKHLHRKRYVSHVTKFSYCSVQTD